MMAPVPPSDTEAPTRAVALACWSYCVTTGAFLLVGIGDPAASRWAFTTGVGAMESIVTCVFLGWAASSIWVATRLATSASTSAIRLVVATLAWGQVVTWTGLLVARHEEPAQGYEECSVVTAGFPLQAVVRLRDDRPGIIEFHRTYHGFEMDESLFALALNAVLLSGVVFAGAWCSRRRMHRSVPVIGVVLAVPATLAGLAFLRTTWSFSPG